MTRWAAFFKIVASNLLSSKPVSTWSSTSSCCQLSVLLHQFQIEGRRQQLLGVAFLWAVEDLLGAALFHHVTVLHHDYFVRQGFHHRQVVTDKQVGETVFALQIPQQLHHLDLHRAVEGGGRLVQQQEFRFQHHRPGDGDALLLLAEEELLAPLDALALREVEAAARQVATVTALVPMALADVLTALVSSLRMIRRVAEIYGGRSGLFSSWRLTRAVLGHLAATGAVAVGDDLLEPVLGGSVLSKLSRRFGEGLVNGALSARVGVAAMEVCRPLPFSAKRRPSVRTIIGRALKGIIPGVGKSSEKGL